MPAFFKACHRIFQTEYRTEQRQNDRRSQSSHRNRRTVAATFIHKYQEVLWLVKKSSMKRTTVTMKC
ncbi:hypothetical protein G9C98_007628 [Cotesia typhae]|uniref:Uncharacterized protein n=1 Tax=Cotesia typhae TaxID=2053667 RepID=A0A8J5QVQ1_9HYME|nr:hypothetical protein G9C98_007628 [Cotesia typhae]